MARVVSAEQEWRSLSEEEKARLVTELEEDLDDRQMTKKVTMQSIVMDYESTMKNITTEVSAV
jgi:hypothetical protein